MGRKPKPSGEKVAKTSISLPPGQMEFLQNLALELFLSTGGGLSQYFRGAERPSLSWATRYLIDAEIGRRTVGNWTWVLGTGFDGNVQVEWRNRANGKRYHQPSWQGARFEGDRFLPVGHEVPLEDEGHDPLIVGRSGVVTPPKLEQVRDGYGYDGRFVTVDDLKPDSSDATRKAAVKPVRRKKAPKRR